MFNILIHQIFFVIRTGFEPITVRNLLFQLIVLLSPSQLCLWLALPHSVYQFRHLTILPHFTRLTDWLPCGSGGFPLFRDSVVRGGIEPPARRFSVYCSTYWAITPNYWMFIQNRMTGVDKGFVMSFRCGTYPLHSNVVDSVGVPVSLQS